MMTDAQLEGFLPDRYFARSWALLTRDRGWLKPVLLLSAALFVPIVGPLGVLGYALEWARLTAWGVASSPKQKNIRVGECIVSGLRAFAVAFVWALCFGIVAALLSFVPVLGPLIALCWSIISAFLGLIIMVATMRATIYQSVAAGLRPRSVWELARRDSAGLLRVFGVLLVFCCILFGLSLLASIALVATIVPQAIGHAGYVGLYGTLMTDAERARMLVDMTTTFLESTAVILVLYFLVTSVVVVIMSLLGYTALGLWFRQFNLSEWGGEKDPLPTDEPHQEGPAPYQDPSGPVSAPDLGGETAPSGSPCEESGRDQADEGADGPIRSDDSCERDERAELLDAGMTPAWRCCVLQPITHERASLHETP